MRICNEPLCLGAYWFKQFSFSALVVAE